MKTLFLAVAAAAALAVTAGPAAAQYPAPYNPAPYGGGYGLFTNHGHPFGEEKGGGAFAGLFSGLNGGGQIQPVDPRSGNAGQLVFPQNPFVRGPRDYFMWDER
jgi:hypothetical protein